MIREKQKTQLRAVLGRVGPARPLRGIDPVQRDRRPYTGTRGMRVISAPNGYWQVQMHPGKNDTSVKGTREHDPWITVGGPTDWVTAAQTAGVAVAAAE